MYARLSKLDDKEKIDELMKLCFGEREDYKVFENLSGRYLLAFDDDKLVAMTGLYYNKEYNWYEMDWTCTHPDYQHKGVMHELFARICSYTDEDIYCSCWRLGGNEHVNLHSLMRDFGFVEVVKNRFTWRKSYNCNLFCVNCNGNDCKCYEDLYLRRKKA